MFICNEKVVRQLCVKQEKTTLIWQTFEALVVDYAYILRHAHVHIVCDVDVDVYVGRWITLSWNFGSYMPNYLLNINIQWSLFSCPIVFISFFILLWMPLQWASKAINKKKTTTYYHQWPDFPCEVSNIVGSICRW